MRLTVLFLLLSGLVFAQDPQVKVPDEVKSSFVKQFPNAHNALWKTDFREANDQRYEVTFYSNPAHYMVSYDKVGTVKAIEKSLSPEQLLQPIKDYLQKNYPTMKISEASEVVTEQKAKTFEVGLVENKNFLVAVFDPSGAFLFMKPVDE